MSQGTLQRKDIFPPAAKHICDPGSQKRDCGDDTTQPDSCILLLVMMIICLPQVISQVLKIQDLRNHHQNSSPELQVLYRWSHTLHGNTCCVSSHAYLQAVMKFRPTVDFQLLKTLPSGSLATKACQHHLTEIKRRKFPQGRRPPSFKFREKKAYFGYNYINKSILMKSSILSPGVAFQFLFIFFFTVF